MIVGYQSNGQEVELDRELETHVHGTGVTRVGKSKLIEHIARELTVSRKSFCLIDPNGTTYRDVLAWLSFVRPNRPVTLLDPSHPKYVTGFNPFVTAHTDPARIYTKVDRMVGATTRVWGREDATGTPRIAKLLKVIYYTCIEQGLPFSTVGWFLTQRHPERDEAIARLRLPRIREIAGEIYGQNTRAFRSYIDSTENRIEAFAHPHLKRIMGVPENAIDIPEIVRKRGILLVNLQASQDDLISAEANRVLGTLLINELWEYFRRQGSYQEFYLVVDECQDYLTPDVPQMVEQGAKYGLHLMLFHQHLGQLSSPIERALINAQTKIEFTGKRRFILTRPEEEPIEAQTPDVEAKPTTRYERYVDDLLSGFMTIEEVEERLESGGHPPPMPNPPLVYDLNPENLLPAFRYLTAAQLSLLTGKSDQVVRKAMLQVPCEVRKLDGKNVYCYRERGKKHENLRHELGITEVHIQLYQAGVLTRWEQSGLREYENPDAFFETQDRAFFLEYQQSNPSESPVEKARRYDAMALQGLHKGLCGNFRVLFVVQTKAKAENLARALAGLPNPCRFWAADRDLNIFCAKHHTHTITVPAQAPAE